MFLDRSRSLLVLLFLAAGLIMPHSAPWAQELSVRADSVVVDIGTEFGLHFYVEDDTTELMGYDILFSFDVDSLELVSVEEGSLPAECEEETFFYSDTSFGPGTVEVSGAILGGVVMTPGVLFTVTFKAITEGKTYVEIEESELRDGSNNAIPHTTRRGIVVIVGEVPVERSSWGRLKAKFR